MFTVQNPSVVHASNAGAQETAKLVNACIQELWIRAGYLRNEIRGTDFQFTTGNKTFASAVERYHALPSTE